MAPTWAVPGLLITFKKLLHQEVDRLFRSIQGEIEAQKKLSRWCKSFKNLMIHWLKIQRCRREVASSSWRAAETLDF